MNRFNKIYSYNIYREEQNNKNVKFKKKKK